MTERELLRRASAAFRANYEREPTHAAVAPGRVNLIGEHTDYNHGFVLPIAIDRVCVAVGGMRDRGPRRAHAVNFGETQEIPIEREAVRRGSWIAYVAGVVAGFAERRGLPAFDLALATSVPIGAGLSSSASLEVAVATLIENMTGAAIGPIDKARLCQRAEHEWAGVPCGIMDQLVSVLGREGHALLIDCRTLDVTHVPMPADAAVVVADTGVRHELAAGEYAKRRAACSSAAAKLGIASLREATSGMADDPCLEDEERRCVRHVTTENERVLRAVEAMRAGDLPVLGRLMNDSHESLRRDYRVSCAELDALVGAARSVEGVLGARMTGGGFGGCAVVLTTIGAVHGVVGTLRAHSPSVAWMRASHGARTTKA